MEISQPRAPAPTAATSIGRIEGWRRRRRRRQIGCLAFGGHEDVVVPAVETILSALPSCRMAQKDEADPSILLLLFCLIAGVLLLSLAFTCAVDVAPHVWTGGGGGVSSHRPCAQCMCVLRLLS